MNRCVFSREAKVSQRGAQVPSPKGAEGAEVIVAEVMVAEVVRADVFKPYL